MPKEAKPRAARSRWRVSFVLVRRHARTTSASGRWWLQLALLAPGFGSPQPQKTKTEARERGSTSHRLPGLWLHPRPARPALQGSPGRVRRGWVAVFPPPPDLTSPWLARIERWRRRPHSPAFARPICVRGPIWRDPSPMLLSESPLLPAPRYPRPAASPS